MKAERLKQFATDPAAFRSALVIETDGGPVPFKPDAWQADDFRASDAAWLRCAGRDADGGCSRQWWERPRGHSKSTDIAVMVVWALLFASRCVSGVACAADKDQAALIRKAIERLVRLNPWIAAVLECQNWKVTNRRTGSELTILAADAPTAFGLLVDFVVCDELVHWRDEELWTAIFSSVAKKRDALLVVITNAGFDESWQHRLRESVRTDTAWRFSRVSGPQASWITEARLSEQRRLLPDTAYSRLWLNEWSSGSGDALSVADVESAVTQSKPMDGTEPGFIFTGGLDLGISRDHSAFAIVGRNTGWRETIEKERPPLSRQQKILVEAGIVRDSRGPATEQVHHPGDGRLRLAHVQSWKPPKAGKLNLQTIEDAVFALHQRFRLAGVMYDPYQCEHLAQRLRRRGVPMVEATFTGANLQAMASEILEQFNSGNVELYGDADLIRDLKRLRIVEKSYGFRLESPRDKSGHGDKATAFVLAVLAAKRRASHGTGLVIDRPIIVDLPDTYFGSHAESRVFA